MMRVFLMLLLLGGVALANYRGFVTDYCLDCHEEPRPKGDLLLEDLKSPGEAPEIWSKVYDQLVLRQMPPEDKEQPPDQDRAKLIAWIKAELTSSGHPPEDKLARPGYGNYVPHEKLFGDHPATPSYSAPRLWRIRPAVYEGRMKKFDSRARFVKPFTLSGGHGFSDYDQSYRLAGADLNQLMANARLAAALLTEVNERDGVVRRGNRTPQEFFELVRSGEGVPSGEDLTKAIAWLYQRTLLRAPRDSEVADLIAFFRKSMVDDGRLLGVRNLISAILLKPEALYRSERGSGPVDEHGRMKLGPREAAYALAFSLTDSPPDKELMAAVGKRTLDLREQASRLLNDPKVSKPRILQFFREYFEYGGALDVFKDEELFPTHSPAALVKDTDWLVLHLYERDRDVLKELLTTNLSFVQFDRDDKGVVQRGNAHPLGAHLSYNLPPDWKWVPEQPVRLPETQRAGILTQPSWLVSKSGNFDNDVIRRGLWVRTKLLGDTIPDLPITVDAQLPEDPHKTLRARMEVTRDEYCWRCHKKMNPLGEPFERYDHFGRWRTRELGKPVDARGAVTLSQDAAIEGGVNGSVEMIHRLAGSAHVRQVFLRHLFRYVMGRNETLHDAASLREVDQAYVQSGGSMKAAILALLTSDSFLFRKEE